MANVLRIGTSGWHYKHWRGVVYPAEMPTQEWFAYYAERFSTVEINNSFYRLPEVETFRSWQEGSPPGFLFAVKASRYITHMKKLRDPEEPLERFFSVFHAMKQKMGPVLVQLPAMLPFNYTIAEQFYRLLKFSYSPFRFVMEVRHLSWLAEESLTLMTAFDIGLVISQSNGVFPYSDTITAKDIYVRFHGPADLYASAYSEAMLQDYANLFRQWVNEGHTVWAYFNNDIHGYAPADAQRLLEMVNQQAI